MILVSFLHNKPCCTVLNLLFAARELLTLIQTSISCLFVTVHFFLAIRQSMQNCFVTRELLTLIQSSIWCLFVTMEFFLAIRHSMQHWMTKADYFPCTVSHHTVSVTIKVLETLKPAEALLNLITAILLITILFRHQDSTFFHKFKPCAI